MAYLDLSSTKQFEFNKILSSYYHKNDKKLVVSIQTFFLICLSSRSKTNGGKTIKNRCQYVAVIRHPRNKGENDGQFLAKTTTRKIG